MVIKWFIDPEFGEFFKTQQKMFKYYKNSLYTIGLRNLRPGGTCSNPESSIAYSYVGVFGIYSATRFASKYITSPIADMIKNKLIDAFIVPTDYGYADGPRYDTDDPGVPEPPEDMNTGLGLVEAINGAATMLMGGKGEKVDSTPSVASPRQRGAYRKPPYKN